MRAAVYEGQNRVVVRELPVPEFGPREVLVRINCCGVCGTDLKKIQYGLVPPPRIFGHEMAGVIAAVGEQVRDWQVCDRVAVMHHVPCMDCYYCRHSNFAQCPVYKKTGTTAGYEPSGGGYAEYIRVMDWVVERGMVRIPSGVTDEEATFIEPVNTVLKGVERCQARPGQTALVVGLGQIGLLFAQCLRIEGVTILGSDPQKSRRKAARKFGVLDTVDPTSVDLPDHCRAATESRGVDIVVVAVPSREAAELALSCVRPGGKVLLFAHTRLNDMIEVDGGAICMLEKDLIGSYSSDILLQDKAASYIFDRKIDIPSLITHRFPLEQIDRAIDLASNPTDNSLKVMVTI